ncbi:Rv2253/PknI dimerization domain-containing protein [Mycolicibacterium llatzerense]|uniref:hypothetical protein n=1 Tax=Mycolicibacterium llatzerense TaxID=280871 RepID=UPI0021B6D48D|nr:hypothetical protein [Mycolicibacterium llatzerense]
MSSNPGDAESVDHNAPTQAGPTQLASAESESSYAWSLTDPMPVRTPLLTPGRITAVAVVASLVVVVAVAAYAGYAMGNRSSSTGSAPSVSIAPPAIPSAPKPPPLDGVYRITYDAAKQRTNGTASSGPQGADTYWAFRSQCDGNVCLASATPLDRNNHDVARTPTEIVNLQYVDARWRSDSYEDQVPQNECLLAGGRVGPGSHTYSSYWSIEPVSENELRGSQIGYAMTNECGFRGSVSDLPMTMARVSDTPPAVHLPEPTPVNAVTPDASMHLGELDGLYRFAIDNTHQTINGRSTTNPAADRVEVWALKSACTTTKCAVVAAQVSPDNPQQNTGQAMLLELIDGQWTMPTLSPQPPAQCRKGPGADVMAMKWSFAKNPDGSLVGVATGEIVTDQCGHSGWVYQSPITGIRTGDIPPTVAIADPASFVSR